MSKGIRAAFGALIGIIALAASTAGGTAASSQQSKTIAAMAGNWTCVTHDSDGKTSHETEVNSVYGPWSKSVGTSPAENGDFAGTSIGFFGYDTKHQRWFETSVDSDGGYNTYYSTSANFDGATWHEAYPTNRGTVVSRMPSAAKWMLDGSFKNAKGQRVTFHQVCTKS